MVICLDQKDFNKEIENIRHDLMLNEYPQEFADSIMKPSRATVLQVQYTWAWSLSHILRVFTRNSDALKTRSGPFSKLSIHSVGQ
jgi:hypothetical protein